MVNLGCGAPSINACSAGRIASPFSSFLADDPLLKVAKAAAPLQARGGTLCFVHKTIQEFETASGVLAVIDKAFSALPIPPHKALELLEQLEDRARESPGGRSVLHPRRPSPFSHRGTYFGQPCGNELRSQPKILFAVLGVPEHGVAVRFAYRYSRTAGQL